MCRSLPQTARDISHEAVISQPSNDSAGTIAVGRPVTRPPPHRSRHADCSHRALQVYSRPQSGLGFRGCHSGLRSPNDPWSFDLEVRPSLVGARPVVAAPLATPIEPLFQNPQGLGEERLEPGKVAGHSVVVVIPAELGIEPRQQDPQSQMAVLPTPLGEPLPGVSKLLAGGSACDLGFPYPVLVPATLESQKRNAGLRGWGLPADGHDPRLLGR